MIAASQEIAASTAQLVVASRVKAERGSERMTALSQASKSVTTATASVLGTVKSGRETMTERGTEIIVFSHFCLLCKTIMMIKFVASDASASLQLLVRSGNLGYAGRGVF